MKAFYCDHFVLPLPEGHRFPMEKYALLRHRVAAYPGVDLQVPDPISYDQLALVHTERYLRGVREGTLDRSHWRRIGFPWSPQLVERSRRSVGGTLAAARAALVEGAAANLAGGTHHAFADRGEGFCVFNDAAVTLRVLQSEARIGRAAIVDLDVHQGNGTAAIFVGDPDVFTLSIHGERNFPFRKERSDLDIGIPDGTGDVEFLARVDESLEAIFAHGPDLVVYVAGADPFTDDRLGRLSVSKGGLRARDRRVLGECRARGIPVAIVMSGGYARSVEDTVEIHATSVMEAARSGPSEPRAPALAGHRWAAGGGPSDPSSRPATGGIGFVGPGTVAP